jgi:CRP-like cAMP-binding protein
VLIDPDKEIIATISRGGMVGELSILDKKERTAWVVALKDILALEFDGEAFVSLIKENNAIAFSMARTLSQRLRNTIRRKNNA